jgi:predicted O-methyltransferase YrrM
MNKAVDRKGAPLPWYTYPMIDFLSRRDFKGRSILEFGGGQSSLWWAARAERLVTIEEDVDWAQTLQNKLPQNAVLKHIPLHMFAEIQPFLSSGSSSYDVIIVDGHRRRAATAMAFEYLRDDGAIILDNAEGYHLYEETKDRKCQRIDFWGYAPGVFLPHCTSLIFRETCFLLSPATRIS